MTLATVFQAAWREHVQPCLSDAGFAGQGKVSAFRRDTAETIQLVVPQKSRTGTTSRINFAVNLGVASKRLIEGSGIDAAACAIEDCHWRRRLVMTGAQDDAWWTVVDDVTAREAMAQVVQAFGADGLPRLDSLADDAALRDLWLSGRSDGLTDVQRLLHLDRLLRSVGPADRAREVTATLEKMARDKPLPVILTYLRKMGEASDA